MTKEITEIWYQFHKLSYCIFFLGVPDEGEGQTFGTKYSRMDQVKFFKGCLPQILLGPFLNALTHL